ncbi:MAG: aspartate/glutamate racemase family protein [Clostridiaceae bacterium]
MSGIIGIIGGMGPLATKDLLEKIILNTEAASDQEHIQVFIDNNTKIPDRTKAILHNGEDPLPEMLKSGKRLELLGADVAIMPCNTAHYFYNELSAKLKIPMINMLDVTARRAQELGYRKVGILATDGTILSGVYKKAMGRWGIEIVTPDADGQKAVMDIIYSGVKAGKMDIDTTPFLAVISELEANGAEALILGCTELPLAFEIYHIDKTKAIDPTLELAKAAILYVGGIVK